MRKQDLLVVAQSLARSISDPRLRAMVATDLWRDLDEAGRIGPYTNTSTQSDYFYIINRGK